MGRRGWIFGSLVVVLALAVGLAAAPAQRTRIRIGYIPTDSMAAVFIAAERYLPQEGFEVELVRLPSGAEILSQVAIGQLQVGGGALGAAAFNAIHEGLPVKFVASLHNGFLEDYFTVRRAVWGSEINRIAQLKGKPVAINARGVVTEYLMDRALRLDGISIEDVDLKTMPFPDMVPALETGAIWAGIISEPFPTIAEERGVGIRPLRKPPGAKPIPFTFIFWNATWAERNRQLAQRFMVAYLRAGRDLALDNGWRREDNMQLMAKYTGASLEIIRKARPHHLDPNLAVDVRQLEDQQRFYMRRGLLRYREPIPIERVFDFTYLRQAIRELGRK
ncbi:MAG: ABC transporter substrate-binding protein [Armatimonadota bacterium]|nr:ABC transporter substrate-binding protein [Armatimonadota bacterium]MDR7440515.1 ABC transporter substrate-binding protein [Armatimonadota bacterium]MDR7445232.1 ABC transporter substrate-binding protein [Armatimonadota bacterium]MDR7571200.1 ABC transporter substrate-binding protein [Armatimonadota bacterium]MDR7615507.1 ABC transporter substrate-binding protein [Armatimonadota bacterium]